MSESAIHCELIKNEYYDRSDAFSLVRVLSDVPSEPQQLAVAEMGADWLRVQWLAPSDSGDCELTGYVVRTQQKGQRSWREATRVEATSSASECCISGLQTGAEYAVRVAAVNELGEGEAAALQRPVLVALPYSAPPDVHIAVEHAIQAQTKWKVEFLSSSTRNFDVMRMRTGVPERPSRPKATRSESEVAALLVAWNRPADGGAPIVSYALEMKRPDEKRWTPIASDLTSTEFTCEGLEFGGEYQFHVAAKNQAGVGAFSEATAPLKCGLSHLTSGR